MRLGLSFTIQLFVIILPLIAAVFTITANNNSALAQENNNNTNANKTSSPSFSAR